MINIVLVVHLLLAIAMVAVIMLQRSEGGLSALVAAAVAAAG